MSTLSLASCAMNRKMVDFLVTLTGLAIIQIVMLFLWDKKLRKSAFLSHIEVQKLLVMFLL
jgi:hypothetical protein